MALGYSQVGNFYNWKTDSCNLPSVDNCTTHQRACTDPSLLFRFPSFAAAMAATNASAVLLFNMIDDSIADTVARLVARAAALHPTPIDWIELGNENYDAGQSCGNINPTLSNPPLAADYVRFTEQVVHGLHAANGSVKGGVPLIAPPLFAKDTWEPDGWNMGLLATKGLYDGFVMHPYVGVAGAMFTSATAAAILEASGVIRGYLEAYVQRAGSQRPLLLTEFGILGTDTGTFVQSLGEASLYMQVLSLVVTDTLNIVQAGIHILLGGNPTSPNSLFVWNSTINRTVATPTGVIWWKFIRVLTGSTLLGTTAAGPTLPSGVPAVDIQALQTASGGLALLIVNKLGVDAVVFPEIDDHPRSVCTVQVFKQPPLSYTTWELDRVEGLWVEAHTSADSVAVPPMSIAYVELCSP
jgi:hypothetical protein